MPLRFPVPTAPNPFRRFLGGLIGERPAGEEAAFVRLALEALSGPKEFSERSLPSSMIGMGGPMMFRAFGGPIGKTLVPTGPLEDVIGMTHAMEKLPVASRANLTPQTQALVGRTVKFLDNDGRLQVGRVVDVYGSPQSSARGIETGIAEVQIFSGPDKTPMHAGALAFVKGLFGVPVGRLMLIE